MSNQIRNTCLFVIAVALTLGLAASCNSGGSSSTPTAPAGGGTGLELNSGDFGQNATFSHRFAAAGTFAYHCVHHAAMTGTVQVSAGAPSMTASVSITSSTSPFPAASVQPGGTVTWTNNTGMIHTVTSN